MFTETVKKNYNDGVDIFSDEYSRAWRVAGKALKDGVKDLLKTNSKEEVLEMIKKNLFGL
jgi:hypothetical protein